MATYRSNIAEIFFMMIPNSCRSRLVLNPYQSSTLRNLYQFAFKLIVNRCVQDWFIKTKLMDLQNGPSSMAASCNTIWCSFPPCSLVAMISLAEWLESRLQLFPQGLCSVAESLVKFLRPVLTSKNQHFKGNFLNNERVIFAYKKFLFLLPLVWTTIVRTQTFLKRIKIIAFSKMSGTVSTGPYFGSLFKSRGNSCLQIVYEIFPKTNRFQRIFRQNNRNLSVIL